MQSLLLGQCFLKDSKNLVIIENWSRFPNWVGPQIKNLTTFALLDVNHAKISDEKSELRVKFYQTLHPPLNFFQLHPSKYFIIAEIDKTTLKLALSELRKSIWWNVYGLFIIQKIHLNSCNETYDYLSIAWNFNILSAVFICMNYKFTEEIHTFNPYSNHAPTFWTKYKSIRQSNNHPMVLFKYADLTNSNSKFINSTRTQKKLFYFVNYI